MTEYTKKTCEACRADAPKATDEQIQNFLSNYSEWKLIKEGEIPQLVRSFKFPNYTESVKFTNKIAELSDIEDHHPAITLEWGRVKVVWWTHKINGLHENDFIMSAKSDEIYKSFI